jgi:hypothetical protein
LRFMARPGERPAPRTLKGRLTPPALDMVDYRFACRQR